MSERYIKPPLIGSWILKLFIEDKKASMLEGDFGEIYNEMYIQNGKFPALKWYWKHLILSLPSIILRSVLWRFIMFKNYMKITFRNIRRHKVFSSINIFGLAVSIACFILMLLYITDETSYDDFHINKDNIYRVNSISTIGGLTRYYAKTPAALGPAITESIPEIEASTIIYTRYPDVQFAIGDKTFDETGFFIVDSTFFNIFSFEFLYGDPKTALSNPNSLVITESLAKRLFGNEEALGKIVSLRNFRIE
ncbi:ABC transporter permease, partial [candidate division KSB1 bacterium]